MSVTSEVASGGFSQWLKGNVIVISTVFGVLLYAVFSIPPIVFYARLGTTPSEVGLSYTNILSGATLGALTMLGVSILLIYFILFYAVYLFILAWVTAMMVYWITTRSRLRGQDWELDAHQFDEKLAMIRDIYSKEKPSWTEVEQALRRRRELGGRKYLTPTEISERAGLNSQKIYLRVFLSKLSSISRSLRPRQWHAYALFLVIIILTGSLALIARAQAGQVLRGKNYFGSHVGLFEYHAEIVSVRPASGKPAKSVKYLAGKKVFLLGQNSQYIILYLPSCGSPNGWTMRIPVAAVIVTNIAEEAGHRSICS
jgi:hypothetical protein